MRRAYSQHEYATALGITIRQSLLVRADEVIQ
jgi:hypothetical protein